LSPIRGRIDDMLKIRGAPVYPTAIEGVLRGFPELGAEFRIIVDQQGGMDTLEVRIESSHGASSSLDLADAVSRAIKSKVGCSTTVTILPFGALTVPDEVAKRTKNRYVVDLRKKIG
jgi:phenylacetate-CoA ligase